jgi:hypothetical protein
MDRDIKNFEQTALSAFSLLAQYGFKHFGTDVFLPDIKIRFRASITEVTVVYEIGSSPGVELGRLAWVNGKQERVEYYGLRFLLMARAPGETYRVRCEINDPVMPSLLERLAFLLVQYGNDVLQGDFSIFLRLRELAYSQAED